MELKNFIGGKWGLPFNLSKVPVINPANGNELAFVPLSSENEVKEAVLSAKKLKNSGAVYRPQNGRIFFMK